MLLCIERFRGVEFAFDVGTCWKVAHLLVEDQHEIVARTFTSISANDDSIPEVFFAGQILRSAFKSLGLNIPWFDVEDSDAREYWLLGGSTRDA